MEATGARSIRAGGEDPVRPVPDPERSPVGLTPLREQQLVAAYRDGDQGALAELLRAYQHRVYAICYRMVSREDALDLTQDALIKVMEGLPGYDGRARLSTWIIRVTMNCCLSHLRKQRIRRHASLDHAEGPEPRLDSGEPTPVDRVQLSEMRAALLRAMRRIDPDLRAVLVLRDLQELDYQQVATVLGMKLGTVKSRLFRARTALRRAAEEEAGLSGHREEPPSR